MHIHPVPLTVVGLTMVLGCLVHNARAADGNAVGGSVWDDKSSKPLDGVTVTVPQDKSISDSSRADDGAYVLKVPANIQKFDILFEKQGYASMSDSNIDNTKPQQKRPIVRMMPKSIIQSLPPAKVELMADQYFAVLKRSQQVTGEPKMTLEGFAKRNLMFLYANMNDESPEAKKLKVAIKSAIDK